jgi:hypothetical protein
MTTGASGTSYRELADLADSLFKSSGDDEERLASKLDMISPELRNELLISDLLNAYQAFYFFFRESPGDLEKERLLLTPASMLAQGIVVLAIDYLEVVFRIDDGEPLVVVRNDEQVLGNYRGKKAYRDAMQFVDDSL